MVEYEKHSPSLLVLLAGVKILNPYLEVLFEGERKIIKPNFFKENYKENRKSLLDADHYWEPVSFTFNITDITGDIIIFLMDKVGSLSSV